MDVGPPVDGLATELLGRGVCEGAVMLCSDLG